MSEIDQIDYGPLAILIGTWRGDQGLDVSCKSTGVDETPFFETLEMVAAGEVCNAESQRLAIVRYHQVVQRQSDGEVFHDQIGYWMWDAERNCVMQSIAIPRAVTILAGGESRTEPEQGVVLHVQAASDQRDWGISQSPFMLESARTVSFEHEVTVRREELAYRETTVLEIYGTRFEHQDHNRLTRVEAATA